MYILVIENDGVDSREVDRNYEEEKAGPSHRSG
jgi:hypothetical protein